jgi:hypothetical protein
MDLKIFPFKTRFRLIKGPFKTGFTVFCVGHDNDENMLRLYPTNLRKRHKPYVFLKVNDDADDDDDSIQFNSLLFMC